MIHFSSEGRAPITSVGALIQLIRARVIFIWTLRRSVMALIISDFDSEGKRPGDLQFGQLSFQIGKSCGLEHID